MPFALRCYNVSGVIFWEAEVMSWFYILGIDLTQNGWINVCDLMVLLNFLNFSESPASDL